MGFTPDSFIFYPEPLASATPRRLANILRSSNLTQHDLSSRVSPRPPLQIHRTAFAEGLVGSDHDAEAVDRTAQVIGEVTVFADRG